MEPVMQTLDELHEFMQDKYDCDVFVTQELYDRLHKIPFGDIQCVFCTALAYMHHINIVLESEEKEV